jgi:hypothetical protein
MKKDSDKEKKERQKQVDKVSKMIHPHDDEPDPTVNTGNYNFPQMIFSFCLGFAVMFVLSVNEIQNFKGCYYESLDYWIKEKS